MGMFDKLKKNRVPERVQGAAMLFCPLPDCEKILEQIEELFQLAHGEGGNNITLRQDDMEIVFLALTPEGEGENAQYARGQLQGVAGYVYQSETPLLEIKRNLFYHLRQCKSLVHIVYSFDSADPGETREKEEQIMTAIYSVTEKLEGIVTFGDGMTLQNGRGEVILDKAGKSELEYYMPAELPLPDDWAKDAPPESLERRNKSMELLRERHIYVTPWLPLLWEKAEEPGRSAAEVCGRAAALLIVSLYSECRMGEHMSYEEAREFVAPILAGYGAEEYFSPKEKEYLDNPASTEQEQIQFAWQYENLWVMEWALGFTDDLFWPDRICDVPGSARLMQEHPTMEALLAAAKLRSRKELLEQADLIYRLHWACVDAQVTGMPAPQNVDAGVVMERHHALFWLAGCDEMCPWDEVDLST